MEKIMAEHSDATDIIWYDPSIKSALVEAYLGD